MDRSIASTRLDLVPLSQEMHRAMLDGNYRQADALLGAHGLDELHLPRRVLQLRLDQLIESPRLEELLLRAIVVREINEVVGNIGFHAAPDASYLLEQGLEGLEFGYTIIEEERRKGYAKEAACALMQWAIREYGVTMFVLSIGPDNGPSNGLALSMGFSKHSVYVHPERGSEQIYTRTDSGVNLD
mgnify:CR=1 FL=1